MMARMLSVRDVAQLRPYGWDANGHRAAVAPSRRETTGERIRRLRLESDRSIRQLAADAGVCHMVVQRAESDHSIYLHNFVAIADVLAVSLDYLWRGEA